MKITCREKKKQLAVQDMCNEHVNCIQHLYRFFFLLSYKPSLYQCVVSLGAIRKVSLRSMWTNILLSFLFKQSSYRTSKRYMIEDKSKTSLVALPPDEREELGTRKRRMRGEGGKGR